MGYYRLLSFHPCYQYTGQYSYTPDFGLYFYNARWYDPTLGRFAQPDSLIPEQSQGAQAWDRFGYANNNPVRYTDPTGHSIDCAVGEQNCSAGKLVPNWWKDPKKHLYIDGYGYFDTGHIKRGWDTAKYMFEVAKTLGEDGH
jgi:RHS repeat-associated protein